MVAVMLQVPLVRSYSSAENRAPPLPPPAASTLPVGSRVAVCKARLVFMLPVTLQVPVAGSYSSEGATLPATITSPVLSRVAVWPERPAVMLPVLLHVPEAGSYNSQERPPVPVPVPPATRTLPLESRVAVWE